MREANIKSHKETNTYLTNVGRGWDGEFLSVDVEDHIRHLANIVTVDKILRAEAVREDNERTREERESKHLVLLFNY